MSSRQSCSLTYGDAARRSCFQIFPQFSDNRPREEARRREGHQRTGKLSGEPLLVSAARTAARAVATSSTRKRHARARRRTCVEPH